MTPLRGTLKYVLPQQSEFLKNAVFNFAYVSMANNAHFSKKNISSSWFHLLPENASVVLAPCLK